MAEVVQLQILDSVVKMCKDILKRNSYYNDVREVNKGDKSVENIKQYPAINVLTGNVSYLSTTKVELARLMKTETVVLDCYIREAELSLREQRYAELLADVEIRFGNGVVGGDSEYNMSGSAYDLEGSSLIVLPVASNRFNLMNTEDLFGFEFSMDVKFRQNRKNPTQLY